ncbi:MAG: class I SAM-dependent methyltransferase [Lachnospiraceae bacterium]|nr:class I SAM-dependent methyltransferase [Lachnospiraceae bacterium]
MEQRSEFPSGTAGYYDEHAQAFIESTLNADVSGLYARFEEKLRPGCSILDLGCGSGRDSLYYAKCGYRVSALDPSPAMCAHTRSLVDIPVYEMQAEDMTFQEAFDAVWACASLLHVPRGSQALVLKKIAAALKEGGICYCSWKYGDKDREKDGRRFTDLTEASFRALLQQVPELREEAVWTTQDVRSGREDQKWLNVLLRKSGRQLR